MVNYLDTIRLSVIVILIEIESNRSLPNHAHCQNKTIETSKLLLVNRINKQLYVGMLA